MIYSVPDPSLVPRNWIALMNFNDSMIDYPCHYVHKNIGRIDELQRQLNKWNIPKVAKFGDAWLTDQ
jgi:hypothetical protein